MIRLACLAIATTAALAIGWIPSMTGASTAWASPGSRAQPAQRGDSPSATPRSPAHRTAQAAAKASSRASSKASRGPAAKASRRPAAKPSNRPSSGATTPRPAGADTEHQRKLRQMTFDVGDEVEGGTAGPGHDTVTARSEIIHSSLIRVRLDFLSEIHKSVESL